jgi:hypothetical protein
VILQVTLDNPVLVASVPFVHFIDASTPGYGFDAVQDGVALFENWENIAMLTQPESIVKIPGGRYAAVSPGRAIENELVRLGDYELQNYLDFTMNDELLDLQVSQFSPGYNISSLSRGDVLGRRSFFIWDENCELPS